MNKLWLLSSGLVGLAWLINENIPRGKPPLVNWDSSLYLSPETGDGLWLLPSALLGYSEPGLQHTGNTLLPGNREEIVHIIRSALANNSVSHKIRVIGSGHSWSKIAVSDNLQLSLEKYKGLVSIDHALKQVTVRAGTTFHELNTILDDNGLAMSILGSVSDQTVAGAISTGTHGSGLGFGNIASLVVGLELVTGNGDIVRLSADSHLDTFRAAGVSIGLLGVITEVTFQCEPSFNLHEVLYNTHVSQCTEVMLETAARSQHVKWWLEMHSGLCATFETNRTTEQPRDNPNHRIETILNYGFENICNIVSWLPESTHAIFELMFTYFLPTPPHDRVDKSHRVFNIPHYFPVHYEGEMVVDIQDCAATTLEIYRLVHEEKLPLNYVVEVRLVKGDEMWLSPNYQQDSCHFTMCIYNPTINRRTNFYNKLYAATAKFKPRFHWGKHFDLTPTDMEILYPKFQEFLKVRSKLDPKGLFLNKNLARTFGLQHLL